MLVQSNFDLSKKKEKQEELSIIKRREFFGKEKNRTENQKKFRNKSKQNSYASLRKTERYLRGADQWTGQAKKIDHSHPAQAGYIRTH